MVVSAQADCSGWISSSRAPSLSFSTSRSKRVWRLVQNRSVVPKAPEAQRSVGADPTLSIHDLVDPPWRNTDGYREPVLVYAQGHQEVLTENLAGGLVRRGTPDLVAESALVVEHARQSESCETCLA